MISESWETEDWRRRDWSRTVESAFQCRACWTRSTNRCWVHTRPKGSCQHWKALSTVWHQRVSKRADVKRLFVSPQINFITMYTCSLGWWWFGIRCEHTNTAKSWSRHKHFSQYCVFLTFLLRSKSHVFLVTLPKTTKTHKIVILCRKSK